MFDPHQRVQSRTIPREKRELGAKNVRPSGTVVKISMIPKDAIESKLRKIVEVYGALASFEMILVGKDQNLILTFVDESSVMKILKDRKLAYGEQSLHASIESSIKTQIFVGGLPSDVDRIELIMFFQEYGNVVDAKVNRCFGFVTFEDSLVETKELLRQRFVQIGSKKVEIKPVTKVQYTPDERDKHTERIRRAQKLTLAQRQLSQLEKMERLQHTSYEDMMFGRGSPSSYKRESRASFAGSNRRSKMNEYALPFEMRDAQYERNTGASQKDVRDVRGFEYDWRLRDEKRSASKSAEPRT